MENKIQTHKIFFVDGVKVGVLGVGIELEGLVAKQNLGNIKYNDPIGAANKMASQLKLEHDCDLIICLSHLGYKYKDKKVSDVDIAQQSHNIDLILGGHTHTFFTMPEEFQNASGAKVLVNQVGWAGIYLGRLDFYFEKKKKRILVPDLPKLVF